jgi:arsenate reductase-like glutaredoxin family protein
MLCITSLIIVGIMEKSLYQAVTSCGALPEVVPVMIDCYAMAAVQILGTKKSNETKKAIRFFSERRISYHFRDLSEKGLSAGELENICRSVDINDLIDTESARYKKRGMEYMDFDIREELLEDPLLVTMPVVRFGAKATVGYSPDEWKRWISDTI